jgi:hypothetical protein
VVDLFSIYLTYINESVKTTTEAIDTDSQLNDSTITVFPNNFSPHNSTIIITYQANLTSRAPPNSLMYDTPTVFYFSSPPNPWNSVNICGVYPSTSVSVMTAASYSFFTLNFFSVSETINHNITIDEQMTFYATMVLPHGM